MGEGDTAESLLDHSGFRLYKRNLSEPVPPPLVISSPSVSPPKMMRLPPTTTVQSAPPKVIVNMFPQTMTATTSAVTAENEGKADFPPSPPKVPELKRSDSDCDSSNGAPDEAPLNLSISREVIRTSDVLVAKEEQPPPSVGRPAAIPALMPIGKTESAEGIEEETAKRRKTWCAHAAAASLPPLSLVEHAEDQGIYSIEKYWLEFWPQ